MERLKGKIAYITGGAKGLGADMARCFSDEGAQVIISDVLIAEGEALAEENANIAFIKHDVTDEESWKHAMSAIEDRFGGLDILVNNAGIAQAAATIEELTLDDWHRVISVDLDSVFLGCKHGIGLMKKSKNGSIINISSILGIVGSGMGQAGYHAAKGGVRTLSKAVALECAALEYSIRCNSLHPGFVGTDIVRGGVKAAVEAGLMPGENEAIEQITMLHPIGRMGVPRDIASAALFLASDESSWMTGAELVIDGGYTAQ
jgi:3(or 17)beta-hydroxysteroid dehydrogenase